MPRRENHSAAARDDEYTSAPFTAFAKLYARQMRANAHLAVCLTANGTSAPYCGGLLRAAFRKPLFLFPTFVSTRPANLSQFAPIGGVQGATVLRIYPVRRMAPSQSGAPSKEKDPALYARILFVAYGQPADPKVRHCEKSGISD